MTTQEKRAMLQEALTKLQQQEYAARMNWTLVEAQVAALLRALRDLDGS